MNLFQLVIKQMRQRALGTWLTLLSVLLGVALAATVLIVSRESNALFGQSDFGYEVIVGPPKGSALSLTLNTVYHLDASPGTLPYSLFEELSDKKRGTPGKFAFSQLVKIAVPFMVGDSYKGHRLVGTSPGMFGFDDADGTPLSGYNDKGERIASFEDPDSGIDERDPTKPLAASTMQYRRGHKYEIAEGRMFHPRTFESVIGSEVARLEKMKVGDEFQATHGMPGPKETPDIHKPKWKVVGILKPTHTANDKVLFLPIISLYAIEEHSRGMLEQALLKAGYNPSSITAEQLPEILKKLPDFDDPDAIEKAVRSWKHRSGSAPKAPDTQENTPKTGDSGPELLRPILFVDEAPGGVAKTQASAGEHETHDHDEEEPDAYHLDANGEIVPDLPKDEWSLSAILVKTRPNQAEALLYHFKNIRQDAAGVSPATTMREFFQTFLAPTTQLLVILAGLVSIVAAVSILVSIYNSVAARQREIAILRALGATRARILTLICAEAGLIGLVGGLLGLIVGHLTAGVGSAMIQSSVGEGINWMKVDNSELQYLAAVVAVAIIAGLVPALKAYSTPVATNLVAS